MLRSVAERCCGGVASIRGSSRAARSLSVPVPRSTFNFTSEEVLRYQWLDSLLANNAQKVTMAVQQPSATNLA